MVVFVLSPPADTGFGKRDRANFGLDRFMFDRLYYSNDHNKNCPFLLFLLQLSDHSHVFNIRLQYTILEDTTRYRQQKIR